MPGFRISPAPRALAVAAIFLACALLVPATTRPLLAGSGNGHIPAEVSRSLALLLEMVQTAEAPLMADLTPLIDFSRREAFSGIDWEVEGFHGATGAYYAYEIAGPMDRIISYLYHPGLPPSLFHPSVLRQGSWIREPNENIPALWESLEEGQIRAVRGLEAEENTPDVNTGGYYSYETDRLLLLLKHEGEKYLISATRQNGESSVGRKGVVLGDDQDWNYYYSGEQGLTRSGLGWVNSTIFDSFSVTVLLAGENDPGGSRHVMFKWVRAGWSGINMVRTGHVRDGCIRFAQSFARLMESERLPEVTDLAAMTRRVMSMDEAELRHILEPYVQALNELSLEDPVLSRRSFRQEIQEDPLQHYSLEAKQSLVMKEYLKAGIGMPALIALPGDIPPYFPRHAGR